MAEERQRALADYRRRLLEAKELESRSVSSVSQRQVTNAALVAPPLNASCAPRAPRARAG